MLLLYNSLSRKKESFIPLVEGKVGMYVCGITVYDYCHIGHARVMVVFDIIYRYLQVLGYDVTYVRNITDIDDKIIQRAYENGESIHQLSERFIASMHEDTAALRILSPTYEPRATDHISHITEMIQQLLVKGYAYQAANKDIYYRVKRFSGYGRLSGKRVQELRAGARVAVDKYKQDPLDFVLWKAATAESPHWQSAWGNGRPGWHIECSAMAMQLLGTRFDIHGGGQDLQFPHHENEIAQSEACTGHQHVNYWIHNGFVRVKEEKMSKSLDNFSTIRQVLQHYSGEVIRLFILNSHYRSPLNYDEAQLRNAQQALTRLYLALRDLPKAVATKGGASRQRFHAAMEDDFNTAQALAVLFDLAREINILRQRGDTTKAAQSAALLQELASILGLLQDHAETFLRTSSTVTQSIDDAAVEELVACRRAARTAKDFAESDRIREQLQVYGIVLEDKAGNTTWRRQ